MFKIIDNFNVYNIRKIKEGKYMILGKIIFVRVSEICDPIGAVYYGKISLIIHEAISKSC